MRKDRKDPVEAEKLRKLQEKRANLLAAELLLQEKVKAEADPEEDKVNSKD